METEFPLEAARDLVGVLRVLWSRQERSRPGHRKKKLVKIATTARKLKDSIRLAADHVAGTAPYKKALNDAAVKELGDIFIDSFGLPDDMPNLVRMAGLRVRGTWKPRTPCDREIKWAVGKQRG